MKHILILSVNLLIIGCSSSPAPGPKDPPSAKLITGSDGENSVQDSAPTSIKTYMLRAPEKNELDRMVHIYNIGNAEWEGSRGVYFSSFEPAPVKKNQKFDDTYNFTPAIVNKEPGKRAEVVLFPEFRKSGWVGATALHSKGYYWGFIDHMVEGGAGSVTVIWSEDNGRSWRELSQIKKDSFENWFESFAVDESGRGLAILRQDNSIIAYDTKDFGRSWKMQAPLQSVRGMKSEELACGHGMWSVPKIQARCKLPKAVFNP